MLTRRRGRPVPALFALAILAALIRPAWATDESAVLAQVGPTPTAAATPRADQQDVSGVERAEQAEREDSDPSEPGHVAVEATPIPKGYPVADDQPADYEVPSGHFYSQAVPGAPRGFGFLVADAGGVPLWSEYRRLGGLPALGYPVSRRYAASGTVGQAFQRGTLAWRAERQQAEWLRPREAGEPPAYAREPEPPLRLGAWAARQPWSGWWWPATSEVGGPHLFDASGPLAKYDRFVAASGRDDPRTLEWERKEAWLEGLSWAGHCNGWAAAALLEDEPTEPITVAGIGFSVADLKGLLSAYHFADAAAWLHGTEDDPVGPADFHARLVEWLGNGRLGFILTFRPAQDEEVWSYPATGFELTMGPDAVDPELTHVRAVVWLADNDVPAGFVGTRAWRGEPQVYHYTLSGPLDAPTGGAWVGPSRSVSGFARPTYIWYPDPKHRNVERQLTSPGLEYRMIQRILGTKQ